jgi:hypothetical protein
MIQVKQPEIRIPEDLKIFLDRKGDSINLIGPDVKGKPLRSLEKVCASISLDSLVKSGKLTLWDQEGTQITGSDIERATNLATLLYSGQNSETTVTGVKSGTIAIDSNSDTIDVAFGSAFSSTDYSIIINIRNNIDDPPSIYSWHITEKTKFGFTAKLSGVTDSANYVLEWVAIVEQ